MADDADLPQIEFAHDRTEISKHVHVYINVRGASLEECKRYFDEIKEGL